MDISLFVEEDDLKGVVKCLKKKEYEKWEAQWELLLRLRRETLTKSTKTKKIESTTCLGSKL